MKIALLGDIGFFGKFSSTNKNIHSYFEDVSELLKKCDFVLGNLEVPLTNQTREFGAKSAYIKGSFNDIELLKCLNISIVSLANNHLFDYGYMGYKETVSILEEYNIDYFGIDNKTFKINWNENKLAFSGYCCYSTNAMGYLEGKNYGVNELNYEKVLDSLLKNDKDGYLNILSVHAGQEHVNYPNYDHIKFARKLSEKLNYVYYGHHPHVLQGIEKWQESLIFYSLGNFCFDDVYTSKSKEPLVKQNENNKESVIVILNIENNKIINYELVPIYDNGNKISINHEGNIVKKIQDYSLKLSMDETSYIEMRNKLLRNYYSKRKETRNVNWYLKRLNFRSVRIIYDLKINRWKYNKFFKTKIK